MEMGPREDTGELVTCTHCGYAFDEREVDEHPFIGSECADCNNRFCLVEGCNELAEGDLCAKHEREDQGW